MTAIRGCTLALCAAMASGLTERLGAQTPRVAPPPPCRADGRVAASELTHRRPPTAPVVAVLPLEARVSAASQVHLPWALTVGISDRISALPGVAVPSRGSTERASADAAGRFDEFAQLLAAKLVVAGFVGTDRTGATISVRITEPGTEEPRWERDFAYPDAPLQSVELQVALAVAEILGLPRPLESGDTVPEATAYDELARGDYFLTLHDPWAGDSARTAYERALERVPSSPVVMAKLARAYSTALERRGRAGPLGFSPAMREANALADRALRGDSGVADAWTARGILERLNDPRTYGAALHAHQRAVRAAPRNADARHEYALTLLRLGREADAAVQLRQALEVENDRASSLRLLAEIEYLDRRFASACALINASIGADSYDPLAYALRARVRLRLDDFRDAFSDAETARRLSGAVWGEALEFYVRAFAREQDAARADARRLSQAKLRPGVTLDIRDAVYLAMGLGAIGDRDRAFDALSRARPRGGELRSLLRDPGFDPLRRDSRFSRVARDESPRSPAGGGRTTRK